MDNQILIIDDEQQIRRLLSRMMELEGYEVFQAGDCATAMKQLERYHPQVALCDVFLPDGNGVELVKDIKASCPSTEVILLTAHGNIPDGVQAIKNGAFDYITKGDDNNKIIPIISRAMSEAKRRITSENKEKVSDTYTFETINGKSSSTQQAIVLAKKAAMTDISILLLGETGTGKEVFAQAIHQGSKRHDKPFLAINCSAFSKDLLESELFGFKAGAFTGAMKAKKGLLEMANKGTLFLDEIGEMAYELQAKLLRVLETGEYIMLGDTQPTKVDVRIISATNRDLKHEIEQQNFREDLYYRLSVFQIQLPPLRERTADIKDLAQCFITSFCNKQKRRPIVTMSPEYQKVLLSSEWKGNIRELRNVIERGLIVCNEELTIQDLPLDMQNAPTDNHAEFEMAQVEKTHIVKVLRYTHGNKTEASRLMKIGLTTLYRKIEDYGIEKEDARS